MYFSSLKIGEISEFIEYFTLMLRQMIPITPKFSKSDGLCRCNQIMNLSCLESKHIYNYWYETYYYSIEVSGDLLVDWTCGH